MDSIIGLVPESLILWVYPSGRIFDEFRKVRYKHTL